jgi:hypothetical protein
MRVLFEILCLIAGLLYLGQLISVVNVSLARRLGLQESPDHTDPIFSHLELWTARWDLWVLWILPAAGVLLLIDHWLWPYATMIGGGAFVDPGGREAAKVLGLKGKGVRVGSRREFLTAMAAYVFFIATGILAIGIGLFEAIGR